VLSNEDYCKHMPAMAEDPYQDWIEAEELDTDEDSGFFWPN